MTIRTHKTLNIILAILLVLVTTAYIRIILLSILYEDISPIITLDSSRYIEESFYNKAGTKSPSELIKDLDYLQYSPKMPESKTLASTVQVVKRMTNQEIIHNLKAKTGLDLGNDPQTWIEHFKSKQQPQEGRN